MFLRPLMNSYHPDGNGKHFAFSLKCVYVRATNNAADFTRYRFL